MATYLIGGRLVAGGGLQAGQITLRRILTSSLSTELVLNDAETIDAKVKLPLRDPVTGVKIDLPQQLVPGRDFIGVMQDDLLLAAGPLWGDPFAFPYTSRLTGAGLWSYFDHRYVLPVFSAGQLPRDLTSRWTGLSLRTIAKRLVQQAISHPSAGLPIDFEPDLAGGHEREYPGSDGTTVGDALRRLTEVEGGPDIAFRPYITEDRRFVRWSMVTGDPELTQPGADWYWDVSAPSPHASMPALDRDGRQLHSRRFQTGATVDDVQIEAVATSDLLTGAGFPLLEAWENRSTVLRAETLQAYADEGVLRGSAHIENRTLEAKRHAHPALGTYQVGDYARIRSAPSARGPEQTVRERIVRISFGADGDVSVDLAPQRVVSGYPIPSSNKRWLNDQLRGIARRLSENKG